LRLLVVSQYFWPENFRINDLVAGLVSRGHEVVVLSGQPNYPEGSIFENYRQDPTEFAKYAGASIVRVPIFPRGTGSMRLVLNYLSFVVSATLLGAWRLRSQKFDAILVFQTSPITAALPAILLRRLKRAPLLMWVLDLWPETLEAVGVVRSPLALRLVGRLVAFIYRRCDRILAQSRAFFANIEHWAGDGSRIRYFPGWPEDVFAKDSTPVNTAPEVAAYCNKFNVMFAGNIGEAQDFPAILEAAHRLRDRAEIHWLIVGDGRAADSVRAEIRRLSLEHRVTLLGRHPIDRMPEFFRSAGALLVSLKAEPIFAMTIPGKVQSYLAAGVPLLGMLDGEGARVIQESGAGLVCPAGDSRALACRVEQLASLSTDERATMGENGRAYVRREFDRDMLVNRLEGWLAEAIRQP
jgi:colanic acid biosynthesis glycosyl transferase WcaI